MNNHEKFPVSNLQYSKSTYDMMERFKKRHWRGFHKPHTPIHPATPAKREHLKRATTPDTIDSAA